MSAEIRIGKSEFLRFPENLTTTSFGHIEQIMFAGVTHLAGVDIAFARACTNPWCFSKASCFFVTRKNCSNP